MVGRLAPGLEPDLIQRSIDNLLDQLEVVQPEVIILMGIEATAPVLARVSPSLKIKPNSTWRAVDRVLGPDGYVSAALPGTEETAPRIKLVPIVHPCYRTRNLKHRLNPDGKDDPEAEAIKRALS